MLLKNMKVKTRLLFSFSITILFALCIALIGLTGLKDANKNLNSFINKQYTADTAVKMCRIEANNTARTLRDMYINTNTSNYSNYAQKVNEGIDGLEQNLTILKKTYTGDATLVTNYENAINQWISIGERAVSEMQAGNRETVQNILLQECSPALDNVISIAKDLDDHTNTMKTDMLNRSLHSTNISSILVLVLLVLGVMTGIIIALKITNSIVNPLKEVEQAVLNMSNGILSSKITYSGNDMIGKVADGLRSSLTKLSSYIHDIDDAMAKMAKGHFDITLSNHFVGEFENIEISILSFISTISSTLMHINQSSDQVSSGSSQVSLGAQALSHGTSEQAAAVEELSATINGISQHVTQNAQNAQNANASVENLRGHLLDSKQQMNEMIQAMKKISTSSTEIEKIIKTIEDIAFQTNVLALNAAVEAARAGTAGKGFAVVADEVRNLANKSGEASKNTSELIESSLSAVEHGSKIADETANSILTVVEEAQKITSDIEHITHASIEQANSIKQVTQGIDQISSVVQTNSATAEESAASSEKLSAQAETLRELVNKFKIDQNNVTNIS